MTSKLHCTLFSSALTIPLFLTNTIQATVTCPAVQQAHVVQRSIDAQQDILFKLCSGIDKLAAASTNAASEAAGAAAATVSASSSLAAAADRAADAATTAKEAVAASTEVLQRQVSPQDSVARAVLEGAVRSVSSGVTRRRRYFIELSLPVAPCCIHCRVRRLCNTALFTCQGYSMQCAAFVCRPTVTCRAWVV